MAVKFLKISFGSRDINYYKVNFMTKSFTFNIAASPELCDLLIIIFLDDILKESEV
jgi:hypothetical protein